MTKDVPFRRISKVLRELGFEFKTLGVERLFTRKRTDPLILMPVYDGRVKAVYVKGIGRVLDETGLLDRDEFERRVYFGNGATTAGSRR